LIGARSKEAAMSSDGQVANGTPSMNAGRPAKEVANANGVRHGTSAAKADLLKEEYFHLQKTLEDFDAKSLTIKSWSVTLSMAGVGVAYLEGKAVILLMAALSGLLFWIVEALWKTFQYAFYDRIYEIEKYYAGELQEISAPRIAHSWSKSWHAGGTKRVFRIMQWPHVWLPHGIVFGGGMTLYLIHLIWGGM
jgi:hypothetical protein